MKADLSVSKVVKIDRASGVDCFLVEVHTEFVFNSAVIYATSSFSINVVIINSPIVVVE